jgi:tetratricopeptide (TPR) repeat protein
MDLGIIVGIIGIIVTIAIGVYFGIKALRPKVPLELERDIVKIRAELHQVALYLDGLPKTKDKNKKALFEKGISLMAQYKYEEAIESFRECLALETDGSEKVALLILIGNSFYAWNKWDPALGSWEEALDAAEKANDERGQAAALGNLGTVYKAKGEWDKAIEFYNKTLEIDKKIGDEHGMAQTFNNLGTVYKDKGEWDKAIEFYDKTLEIDKKIGDEHGMAQTKANIGILYKEQGKKEDARRLLEESLRAFERIGDRPNAEIARKHLEEL